MSRQITIVQLEAAINRLLREGRSSSAMLPPTVILLAEIYGWMIYHRLSLIDIGALSADCRDGILPQLENSSG